MLNAMFSGPYGFYVRDALVDALLLQGEVDHGNIAAINGIDGKYLLGIKTGSPERSDGESPVQVRSSHNLL
jgi:hypothetical protein